MDNCNFTYVLNRLRKSSNESIDNTEKFDKFKEYMHVTRPAEEDLKEILRKVNASEMKTLVLLCGSAGDGKSHLLSYLKNSDKEDLLADYVIFNDATESSSPSKTAIETLNELLNDFRDTNLKISGKNVILAINLGVLSNFIESEFGDEFTVLRKYVDENNILTTKVNNSGYEQNSYFQYVSFSDYHMYSLTENGIHAKYIEDILEKVFSSNEENDFYQTYITECQNCSLATRCPVKANYEYLSNEKRRKYVANLLVRIVVKDKFILTTREILNFIYDIVVSKDFSYTEFQKLVDDTEYLKKFLRQITPALLFESDDVSVLMNMLKNYDPLLERTEKADKLAISYYVSSDISNIIESGFSEIIYENIICNKNMLTKINKDKVIRSYIFKIMSRVIAIENETENDEIYTKYISDLYMFNSGKGRKLGELYEMVENAVTQWCGSDGDGNLCLDAKHKDFSLFEKVKFYPNISHVPKLEDVQELQKFVPSIIIAFEDKNRELIFLDIDYSLYELLYKLNHGYIQTADDRNNHADFISFINKILQNGELEDAITIMSLDGRKAIISQGMFGYKFKVVK